MHQFLKKSIYFLLAFLLLNVAYSIIGLFRLHKRYLNPNKGIVILQKDKNAANNILVIGCSNLQHNIQFKTVQDSINEGIDFLYFPGTENASLVRYLSDGQYFSKYKKIILYVPYHLLQKADFLSDGVMNYREIGNYNYAVNLIKHRPILFFYDWNKYYQSISYYRTGNSNGSFIVNEDKHMDSLLNNETTFKNCNEKFIVNKQIIYIPEYNTADLHFLKKLFLPNQQLFICYSPIPNVSENIASINKSKSDIIKNFQSIHQLNEPRIMDSSLFFDQWYHLNYCGQQIETQQFIRYVHRIVHL